MCVLLRVAQVLKPGLIKGQWGQDEDAQLTALVQKGFKNWGHLAAHMPGRTSKQCRERWCHHLDPSINRGASSCSITPHPPPAALSLRVRRRVLMGLLLLVVACGTQATTPRRRTRPS